VHLNNNLSFIMSITHKIKKFISSYKYFTWIQFFSNWVFQGVGHADKTEKIYKITFTLFFFVIIIIYLTSFQSFNFYTILLAFSFAHTFNWFINCNLFVLLVHRVKWVTISKIRYFNYLKRLQKRFENRKWAYYCVCMGSICQGGLDKDSDIDITIVRKRGFFNAISTIIFYVYEKKYADFHGIPLDIFISDSVDNNIKKSKNQDNPIVIYDPFDNLNKYFKRKQTINDAMKINNV